MSESGGRCRRMSAASIGQLNTLLKLTLRPIGLVVYERPNFSAKRPRPAGFVPMEQRRVRLRVHKAEKKPSLPTREYSYSRRKKGVYKIPSLTIFFNLSAQNKKVSLLRGPTYI